MPGTWATWCSISTRYATRYWRGSASPMRRRRKHEARHRSDLKWTVSSFEIGSHLFDHSSATDSSGGGDEGHGPGEPAPALEPPRNGDDARNMGNVVLDQHPLRDEILAWQRIADAAKKKT